MTVAINSPNIIPGSASGTGSSNISTTSSSFVDVTGVTCTLTTNGGKVLVICVLPMKTSSLAGLATFNSDGSDQGILATTSSLTDQTLTFVGLFSPAAGSHTYSARYRNNDGASTISINMSSIQNGTISAVEII